ncbi:hypothetical protein [Synechococcus sp. WH 5701]|uniref:hypothetical protein n=1 Tax=Synechococcus sp. WH 5701 TaxID=69042 RepID=UPI0012EA4988|nr:hypothetical protein [Synechococcus sp. WH 5701]
MRLPPPENAREILENRGQLRENWNPNPEASDKVISLRRKADIRIKDQWPDHLNWMVDVVIRIRKVFGPRIKALQLDGFSSGSEAVEPE